MFYANDTNLIVYQQKIEIILFLKNGPIQGLCFCLFSSFQHATIYIDKSIDDVFRIRTRGGRMEGTDESTELWRHPENKTYNNNKIWHFGKKVVAAKSFEKHIFLF